MLEGTSTVHDEEMEMLEAEDSQVSVVYITNRDNLSYLEPVQQAAVAEGSSSLAQPNDQATDEGKLPVARPLPGTVQRSVLFMPDGSSDEEANDRPSSVVSRTTVPVHTRVAVRPSQMLLPEESSDEDTGMTSPPVIAQPVARGVRPTVMELPSDSSEDDVLSAVPQQPIGSVRPTPMALPADSSDDEDVVEQASTVITATSGRGHQRIMSLPEDSSEDEGPSTISHPPTVNVRPTRMALPANSSDEEDVIEKPSTVNTTTSGRGRQRLMALPDDSSEEDVPLPVGQPTFCSMWPTYMFCSAEISDQLTHEMVPPVVSRVAETDIRRQRVMTLPIDSSEDEDVHMPITKADATEAHVRQPVGVVDSENTALITTSAAEAPQSNMKRTSSFDRVSTVVSLNVDRTEDQDVDMTITDDVAPSQHVGPFAELPQSHDGGSNVDAEEGEY